MSVHIFDAFKIILKGFELTMWKFTIKYFITLGSLIRVLHSDYWRYKVSYILPLFWPSKLQSYQHNGHLYYIQVYTKQLMHL